MMKAKEALTNSSNDVTSSIAWLEKDSAISGAKKARKVQGRQAKEGGIGVTIIVDGAPSSPTSLSNLGTGSVTLPAKAGIVELNCETDFVGRNEIFQSLLKDIAHTVALFPTLAMNEANSSSEAVVQSIIDIPTFTLMEFPLIPRDATQTSTSSSPPRTVRGAILDIITRLGEKIHLARASALSNVAVPSANTPRRSENDSQAPWLVASGFTHGGISQPATTSSPSPVILSSTGRVASLLLTKFNQSASQSRRDEQSLKAMRAMARSLARQTAGMPTSRISSNGQDDDELSLYNQAFIMKLDAANLPGQEAIQAEKSVETVLAHWGKSWVGKETVSDAVSVLQFRRWELGQEVGIKID